MCLAASLCLLYILTLYFYFKVSQEYPDVPHGDYGVKQEELAAMSKEHDVSLLHQLGGVSLLVFNVLLMIYDIVKDQLSQAILSLLKEFANLWTVLLIDSELVILIMNFFLKTPW